VERFCPKSRADLGLQPNSDFELNHTMKYAKCFCWSQCGDNYVMYELKDTNNEILNSFVHICRQSFISRNM